MKKRRFYALVIFLFFISGCSLIDIYQAPEPITKLEYSVDLNNSTQVRSILGKQYQEWQGTRYRSGGLSRNGIDCSGFVYITFRSKFGIDIPRTTKSQVKLGNCIEKGQLRAGDLVFFRTDVDSNHVGIYFSNKNFIHVSRKKGVMISNMNDSYWEKNFHTARRVVN